MNCCVNKNYYSPQKKWILLLNTAEIRRKTHLRQPYCNLYAYGANNSVRYIDPTGQWIDNEDGTFTAEAGDTLYDLFGENWQEKSGFTRDPRTLQVGETVGKKNRTNPVIENTLSNVFITRNDGNNTPYDDRSTSEKVGDFLIATSLCLNFISMFCLYTGNIAAAETLDGVAIICDLGAAVSYSIAGKRKQAAGAIMAVMLDVVPGPYKFNKGAARFAETATGKFVAKAAGRSANMTLKAFGLMRGGIK